MGLPFASLDPGKTGDDRGWRGWDWTLYKGRRYLSDSIDTGFRRKQDEHLAKRFFMIRKIAVFTGIAG
ncbi:MAG TPA: hypothetical protein VK041_02845, partial [Opitutales bacterium]|nr:hypothetical protein [Opitutales bacterium]